MDCPNCRAAAPDGAAECPACGVVFAKWKERAARAAAEKVLAAEEERRLAADPAAAAAAEEARASAAPLTARQAVALPAAVFAASFLLAALPLTRFFVQAGLSMQVHELGHALASWFGGRLALPVPLITLTFDRARSWPLVVVLAAGLGALAWRAWEEDCRALAALCAAALPLQAGLTFFASPDALDFWISFGGLGGECYVAALLVILYFVRWPRFARWPAYRVLALFVGASTLAASLLRWRAAAADFTNVPWGSVFGGDGDVEAMLAAGWTINRLVAVYLRLSWACVGACAAAWAAAAWEHRRLWRTPAELLD